MLINRDALLLIVKDLNKCYMSTCKDSRGVDFIVEFKKLLNSIHSLGFNGVRIAKRSEDWHNIKLYLEKVTYTTTLDLCIELKLIKRSITIVRSLYLTDFNSELTYAKGVTYSKRLLGSNFTEGGKLYEESRRYGVDLVSPYNNKLVLGRLLDITMERTDMYDKVTEKYIYRVTGRVVLTNDGAKLSKISTYDVGKPVALLCFHDNEIKFQLTPRLHFKYLEKK